MTSATKTPHVRELLAERFGEDLDPLFSEATTGEAGRRARFIATMHALIAWVVAHPDLPAPWSCSLAVNVADMDALAAAADVLGVQVFPKGDSATMACNFDPLGQQEFYTPIAVHLRTSDRPL